MKFRRPQPESLEINLTPLIDCLLFLLVFLLVSTSFNQHSRINLSLPDAQGIPPKSSDKQLEVVVLARGFSKPLESTLYETWLLDEGPWWFYQKD